MPYLKNNKLYLVCTLAFILVGLSLKCFYSQKDIFIFVNQYHYPFANVIFKYLTHIGDGFFMIALGIFLLWFNYQNAILVISVYASTSILAQFSKRLFHTPRPVQFFKDLNTPIHLVEGVKVHAWNSFPSGHSTTAFACGWVLSFILTRIKSSRSIELTLFILASLVSFSRIYLAQHFLEDVMGGAFLGTSIALITTLLLQKTEWFNSSKLQRGLRDYK